MKKTLFITSKTGLTIGFVYSLAPEVPDQKGRSFDLHGICFIDFRDKENPKQVGRLAYEHPVGCDHAELDSSSDLHDQIVELILLDAEQQTLRELFAMSI